MTAPWLLRSQPARAIPVHRKAPILGLQEEITMSILKTVFAVVAIAFCASAVACSGSKESASVVVAH